MTQETKEVVHEELVECHRLRTDLVRYMATKHGNQITGLAKELDCSVAAVSRYIRYERPMSGPFIQLIRGKLKGFDTACNEALNAMGAARWMKD